MMTMIASSTPAAGVVPAPHISVVVENVEHGSAIPAQQALCIATANGKSEKIGKTIRPAIRWSGAPKDTKSFAVFIMATDAPANFDDADKDGKTIPANARRQTLFHYGLVEIPATVSMLSGGDADESVPGTALDNDIGMSSFETQMGLYSLRPRERHLPSLSAYVGPCPPWNDERVHRYHYIVMALDGAAPISVPNAVSSARPGDHSNNANRTYNRLINSSHVLATGAVIGTYTLNPNLKP